MKALSLARTMRRRIVLLALPNILSNITVPLLSLVDVGLAGHTPEGKTAIGAVAVASGVVSTLYWLFGFLRMGTTGFVAQCFGARDLKQINQHLAQGLSLALLSGLLLFLATPLVSLFVRLMAQDQLAIAASARLYVSIALCGAPAAMLLYVLNGWFIGMQNTRIPMIGAISINLINIVLSALFVQIPGWGVEGLALGTIIAQYVGVLLLGLLAVWRYGRVLRHFCWRDLFRLRRRKGYFSTQRDLFIRSALLSAVTLFFTYASTSYGEEVVAANTLLLQFFHLFSYFMDGFAYAGEALTGRYVGMQRRDLVQMLVRQLFFFGWPLALLTSLFYLLVPSPLLHLLSDSPEVVAVALRWVPYIAFVPLLGFAAFLWDGVFVGATYARGLRTSMLVASALFFGFYYLMRASWGVAALWISFDLYLAARGLVQWRLWRRYTPKLTNL